MSTENGWMPIETAPKDGTPILALGKSGAAVVRWCASDVEFGVPVPGAVFGWHISDGHNDPIWYRGWPQLTHWMPLPPPPSTDGRSP